MPAPTETSAKSEADTSTASSRLLDAARQIILRDGYAGLTTRAIASKAGLRSSLIHYHFGGKGGLVAALIDQELKESKGISHRRDSDTAVEGVARVQGLLDDQQRVAADARLFFELIPSSLRDEVQRAQLAAGYQAYRDHDFDILRPLTDVDDETLNRLITLSIALVDGISLQGSIDPEHFDLAGAYSLWKRIFHCVLETDALDNTVDAK